MPVRPLSPGWELLLAAQSVVGLRYPGDGYRLKRVVLVIEGPDDIQYTNILRPAEYLHTRLGRPREPEDTPGTPAAPVAPPVPHTPALTDYDRALLDALLAAGEPITAKRLASLAGKEYGPYLRRRLKILKDAGLVVGGGGRVRHAEVRCA